MEYVIRGCSGSTKYYMLTAKHNLPFGQFKFIFCFYLIREKPDRITLTAVAKFIAYN